MFKEELQHIAKSHGGIAYTHTYIYMHSTHTYIHTYTYIHALGTYIHTYIYVYTYIAHTYIRFYSHTTAVNLSHALTKPITCRSPLTRTKLNLLRAFRHIHTTRCVD